EGDRKGHVAFPPGVISARSAKCFWLLGFRGCRHGLGSRAPTDKATCPVVQIFERGVRFPDLGRVSADFREPRGRNRPAGSSSRPYAPARTARCLSPRKAWLGMLAIKPMRLESEFDCPVPRPGTDHSGLPAPARLPAAGSWSGRVFARECRCGK